MSAGRWLGALLALLAMGAAPADRYAAGQIWNYHNRPQDAGSRIKIQRAAVFGGRPVYHIAVSGIQLAGEPGRVTQHLPVSAQTLDASVTDRATGDFAVTLAQTDEGIAEWERAQGGVFTITLSEIIDLIDQTMAGGGDAPPPAHS